MKNRPKPWVIDLLWAGIFSAFFVFNGLQTSQDLPPVWADFPEIDAPSTREYGRSKWANTSYPNYVKKAPKGKEFLVRPTVASDTVSDLWLRAQGWPDWKAEGFVRDRQRWGGVDSLLLQRYDQREEFHWLLSPPLPQDLNAVPEELLYAHPLWRSTQVRAFHRFRSKIRPLRSFKELFDLAPFDSIQQQRIPMYFYFGK
jgi:hypothetical protein